MAVMSTRDQNLPSTPRREDEAEKLTGGLRTLARVRPGPASQEPRGLAGDLAGAAVSLHPGALVVSALSMVPVPPPPTGLRVLGVGPPFLERPRG